MKSEQFSQICIWLQSNSDWFLSGLGTTAVVFVLGLFVRDKISKSKMSQSSGKNSINVQAGESINISNSEVATKHHER